MSQHEPRLQPHSAEALTLQGIALWQMNRFAEALSCFDQALPLAADKSGIFNKRGIVLAALRRIPEALESYDRAVALKPDYAEAWNNRGALLRDMQCWEEAVASFTRSLAVRPLSVEALINRGMLLGNEINDIPPAIRDLEQAMQLAPGQDYLRGDLLHLKMHVADWDGFAQQVSLIDAGVRGGARIATPFMYQAISASPRDLQDCARLYADDFHPPMPPLWNKARKPRDKIRIGYVSGEFRLQATALLAAGLYEQHDREKFEVLAFDNGRDDGTPMRRRLEKAFDRFIDIAQLSDDAAAACIAEQEVDILVNLNGYFGAERMNVFARRPAPIQVSFLGFPGTLGVDYIDYLVADRVVIPPDEHRFYTENIVTLPDSYQVNDSRRPLPLPPPTRAVCGLPEKGFVFCNFNHGYKLTPDMFSVWMRLLARVEGSVLWLLQSNPHFVASLRRAAQRHGIAGERLVFAQPQPQEQHMARLALADLFIDSLPCNAHTTGSDTLWAGVPLLTCRGAAFSGRVGASLLQACGLPELVCETMADYETLAVTLAQDPVRLGGLRARLAATRTQTPLFDTGRFRRRLESAYVTMWERFRNGAPPRGFDVRGSESNTS